MIEHLAERADPRSDTFARERDGVARPRRGGDRLAGNRSQLSGSRRDAVDNEQRREPRRAFGPAAIFDGDGERRDHGAGARVGLVEPRRVDLGIGRTHPKRNLAVAERVRRQQARHRSDAVYDATELWLRDLKTLSADAQITRDRRAIHLARSVRHETVQGVALRAHCERDARLAAKRVDPGGQTTRERPAFPVRERCRDRAIEVRRDPEGAVGRAPDAAATSERYGRSAPRSGELALQARANRGSLEGPDRNTPDAEAGKRTALIGGRRRGREGERERDHDERRDDELPKETTRGA